MWWGAIGFFQTETPQKLVTLRARRIKCRIAAFGLIQSTLIATLCRTLCWPIRPASVNHYVGLHFFLFFDKLPDISRTVEAKHEQNERSDGSCFCSARDHADGSPPIWFAFCYTHTHTHTHSDNVVLTFSVFCVRGFCCFLSTPVSRKRDGGVCVCNSGVSFS